MTDVPGRIKTLTEVQHAHTPVGVRSDFVRSNVGGPIPYGAAPEEEEYLASTTLLLASTTLYKASLT